MSKQKNITYHRYFVTISPKSGTVSLEQLVAFKETMIKKASKYAFVVEEGANGTHPHVHLLIEYPENKRKDTLIASVKNLVKRMAIETFVNVKPSYNPLHLLENYLTKEQVPEIVGFDLSALRQEVKGHNRSVYRKDSQRLRVTRDSFLDIYEQLLPRMNTTFTLSGADEHLTELCQLLYLDNYAYSFPIYNKRQVLDLLKLRYSLNDKKIIIEFLS